MWQPLCITEKRRIKSGPATGRPTPWSADSVVVLPYKNRCTGSPWHSLCPVLPVSLRAPSSSALFALISLQVHKKKKKKISLFCISICISFASRVYLLLFTRTCLWWYYYPARTVLWCVIAHKNDFCGVLSPTRMIFVRGNHAPQGLLTLGQLTWFSLTLT